MLRSLSFPLAFLVLVLLAGLGFAQTTYSEESAAAGLAMDHVAAVGHPMVGMAGGGTVADFDNDGAPDVFVCSGGTVPDRLFLNDGAGGFSDQAAQWGLTDLHYGSGCAAADYDRDGWIDLYVTSFGTPPHGGVPGSNRLYRNTGQGGFVEVAAFAGVQFGSDAADNFSAAWGDYDRDGWLDLFVCAYGAGNRPNRLYHNEGDGTFTDVTSAAGLSLSSVHGLAVSFSDMNADRYPELIVLGDAGSSRYYVNQRDGTFKLANSSVPGIGQPNAMGIATGDYDRDGDLDFYVSDIYYYSLGTGGNRLFMNEGPASSYSFVETGRTAGVYLAGWGWGMTATDIDNDGWLDLVATNGWPGAWAADPTCVFWNSGGAMFSEISAGVGLVHTGSGRSCLRFDADLDGDEDLLITETEGPLRYYRNDLANANAWFDLVLDTSANEKLAPDGIGTTAVARVNGVEHLRQLDSSQSYLGQNELVLHWGLAGASKIDELRVTWADGFTTRLRDVAVNQRLLVAAREPLSHTPLRRGTYAVFSVHGAEPGEAVYFAGSTAGFGTSFPIPELGGMALDLQPPLAIFGMALAGAGGRADFLTRVPLGAPRIAVYTQAVVPRGATGEGSLKTNAAVDVIR